MATNDLATVYTCSAPDEDVVGMLAGFEAGTCLFVYARDGAYSVGVANGFRGAGGMVRSIVGSVEARVRRRERADARRAWRNGNEKRGGGR